MSVAAEQKTKTLKNYVGGSWVDVTGAELHDVINPATGAAIAPFHISTAPRLGDAGPPAKSARPSPHG